MISVAKAGNSLHDGDWLAVSSVRDRMRNKVLPASIIRSSSRSHSDGSDVSYDTCNLK